MKRIRVQEHLVLLIQEMEAMVAVQETHRIPLEVQVLLLCATQIHLMQHYQQQVHQLSQ